MITGKTLLKIDRLFWLPYVLSKWCLDVSIPKRNPGGRTIVIKFMGLGSLIQIDRIFEQSGIDRTNLRLLTLSANKRLGNLTGFSDPLCIRTNNPIVFLIDCLVAIHSVRKIRPSLIVDYERCSFSVSLFRNVLALMTGCRTISFEQGGVSNTERQTILNVNDFNQEQLIMKGAEPLPRLRRKTPVTTKSKTVRSQKILININVSNYLTQRRYPAGLFAEVIKRLQIWDPDLAFYFTGSKEEYEYVESFKTRLTGIRAENVAGSWTLEKFRDELATSALFITGDSGPLHLAVKLAVPTIAIWGPTQPEHFGYSAIANLHNISLRLSCSPCFIHPRSSPAAACNGRVDCLSNLPVVMIVEKAIEILTPLSEERARTFITETQAAPSLTPAEN